METLQLFQSGKVWIRRPDRIAGPADIPVRDLMWEGCPGWRAALPAFSLTAGRHPRHALTTGTTTCPNRRKMRRELEAILTAQLCLLQLVCHIANIVAVSVAVFAAGRCTREITGYVVFIW